MLFWESRKVLHHIFLSAVILDDGFQERSLFLSSNNIIILILATGGESSLSAKFV
jgi:hypothetical protein